MGTTLDLQNKLKQLLGSDNVYFGDLTNVRMQYPCFTVSRGSANHQFADNKTYGFAKRYLLTYIGYETDPDMIETVVREFQMCTYDRSFVSDNLHHDTFNLYW